MKNVNIGSVETKGYDNNFQNVGVLSNNVNKNIILIEKNKELDTFLEYKLI